MLVRFRPGAPSFAAARATARQANSIHRGETMKAAAEAGRRRRARHTPSGFAWRPTSLYRSRLQSRSGPAATKSGVRQRADHSPFSTSDKTALVTLFEEMQRHYRVPCPPRNVIESNLATLPPGVEIMVAETDRIIGFAAFAAIYPGPGLQSGLFMKELFVTAGSWGSGVGKALIQAIARVAVERGHSRVDWTADRNDSGLLHYYSGLGAWRSTKRFSTASRAMRSRRWQRRGDRDVPANFQPEVAREQLTWQERWVRGDLHGMSLAQVVGRVGRTVAAFLVSSATSAWACFDEERPWRHSTRSRQWNL